MTVDHHTALDAAVFHAVNAGGGRVLDALAVTLSAPWFGVLTFVSLALAIAAVAGRRRVALLLSLVIAVVLSDMVGSQVLKPLFGRMRPCYALPPGTFRWLARAANVGSLPSLHASNFFAMASVAWAASRRLGGAVLVLAAAVALSRVYVGVHWPSDIVAGAVWGVLCAVAALALVRRAERGRAPAGGPSRPER
ncbi:phosphatase PAP2 family protein [Anaeromyxobacter oryzisoli]|uniref:phosphatase PAP2 family protein n=1 Tax=Anaeromyxobacter oryzisoli TaxID=2925408 RepID=UPI001F594214|nr:phosphatase PAP2 family protein [Anaeromyxobacter sp. SG63]